MADITYGQRLATAIKEKNIRRFSAIVNEGRFSHKLTYSDIQQIACRAAGISPEEFEALSQQADDLDSE